MKRSPTFEGFEPHFKKSAFTDPWESLLSRTLDDQVRIGVELRPAHCKSRGLVHGAFLAAITDNAIGLSIGTVLRSRGLGHPTGRLEGQK